MDAHPIIEKPRERYPQDVKYSKEHVWVKVDGENASIGITEDAQKSIGDIVHVDLPKIGTEVAAGEEFGTVEAVKTVADLYAPVSGMVTEVNGELATLGGKVNEDPYGAWMIKITLKDPLELKSLLSAAEYKEFVASKESTKNH
jgi:glycine cleavage system H protein